MRLLLEAYYEPQFSCSSHGFRPQRGCHTALSDIYDTWTGTTWFIEGDIAQYFDSLDHQVLLSILREKLHDGRFLRLIETLLQAGYAGRLALPCHAERVPARQHLEPRACQYLPGQTGHVCRNRAVPSLHPWPWAPTKKQPSLCIPASACTSPQESGAVEASSTPSSSDVTASFS